MGKYSKMKTSEKNLVHTDQLLIDAFVYNRGDIKWNKRFMWENIQIVHPHPLLCPAAANKAASKAVYRAAMKMKTLVSCLH